MTSKESPENSPAEHPNVHKGLGELPADNPPADSEPIPMISGKLVISTMVAVALAMAAFAWWARYSQSQQVLEVWGKDAVVAIRTSKRVELLKATSQANQPPPTALPKFELELPTGTSTEKIGFVTVKEISKTPGLIHCRHHLVHQKGFDWFAERKKGCQSNWTVGLRFLPDSKAATSKRKATMLFDFACNRVFLVERQAEVTMRPIIADALKEFFGELK